MENFCQHIFTVESFADCPYALSPEPRARPPMSFWLRKPRVPARISTALNGMPAIGRMNLALSKEHLRVSTKTRNQWLFSVIPRMEEASLLFSTTESPDLHLCTKFPKTAAVPMTISLIGISWCPEPPLGGSMTS